MENKKTISYLNNKVWYRFLKVVFVFVGLLSILIFNGLVIAGGTNIDGIDNKKTEIYCNYWTKATFTPASIGVNLSYTDYLSYSSGGVDDGKYQTIAAKCYGNPNTVYDWRNTGVPVGTPIFGINPVYTYDYVAFIKLLVIGNLIILFILEGVRRTFYYIVLGSLNPRLKS